MQIQIGEAHGRSREGRGFTKFNHVRVQTTWKEDSKFLQERTCLDRMAARAYGQSKVVKEMFKLFISKLGIPPN